MFDPRIRQTRAKHWRKSEYNFKGDLILEIFLLICTGFMMLYLVSYFFVEPTMCRVDFLFAICMCIVCFVLLVVTISLLQRRYIDTQNKEIKL